jgi:hypothetical protein
VDLKLTPGAVITGTVRRAGTGRPVEGATVWAGDPTHPHGYFGTAWTRADGTYRMRLLPSTYQVNAYVTYGPQGAAVTVAVAEGETKTGVDLTVASTTVQAAGAGGPPPN